ncbi:GATA zinc finger domain-containing protein 4-like [Panonychus citri]|uniref:GATA zinc finger domain-containing protein 4-like n=1 Tax=Panonychus citri TaxID=50023 RepID=UPI0023076EEF|nr:GATA zinc finger domain-containing protein 4-like [Panonychus citri]
MLNSIQSPNCNNQLIKTNKSMTKDNHYHQNQHNQHPNKQYQHNHNHNHNRNCNQSLNPNPNPYHYHHNNKSGESKKSSTISLNIHDTNDIRYSQSNTQLQLKRLSLSASLIEIYFGKHYRSPDVLVVSGFILILIGLGAILISVYVYFNEDQFQEMTFLGGSAMMAIGFICCSCRIIFFGPHLLNCCPTIKSSTTINTYHNQRRPTNPPFFTAASTAMSTVTCIGVKFNSNQSTEKPIESSSKSIDSNSIHGNTSSLESIETIKDEICDQQSTNQIDHNHKHKHNHDIDHDHNYNQNNQNNQKIKTINPIMLQYISNLGNKSS